MDYRRIYRQLIEDRRLNQPALGEYAEVHHVLPRCMGGGDEPGNLVRLRPEDHFLAHLLLAKGYRTPWLWSAAYLMAERAGGSRSYLTRVRRLYGAAKRGFAETFVGKGHPNYDHRVFNFVHRSGDVRRCTKYDLCAEFGLDIRNLTSVCAGRKKTLGGWTLEETAVRSGFFWGRPKGACHANTDKSVRLWRHRDGREFVGTTRDLLVAHGLTRGAENVVRGKCQTWQGWFLGDRHSEFPDSAELALPKRLSVSLRHIDGRVLTGPRPVVRKSAGITPPEMTMVLKGTMRHAKGWMLPETDPSTLNVGGAPPLRRSKVQARVTHPELGAFVGDASSFRERFYPGDKSNAASAFAALAAGRERSWRSWRLVSEIMPPSALPTPETWSMDGSMPASGLSSPVNDICLT